MMDIESYDEEISRLFNDARTQLEKIEGNSKQQKKQVVKDLAKSLEGKIQRDTICVEITNQLRGQVSESFVRQCLDDKYKQSHRVENAKKQNKKQNPSDENKDSVEKLASLPTLSHEGQTDKIIVEANGQSVVQEDENKVNDYKKYSSERKWPFLNDVTNSSIPKEVKPIFEKEDDSIECGNCLELQAKVIELSDALKKATQFVTAGKPTSQDKSLENSNIIEFECSMVFDKMQKYLAQLFPKIHSYGDVWLKGQINKKTGKVISFDFGRLNQA